MIGLLWDIAVLWFDIYLLDIGDTVCFADDCCCTLFRHILLEHGIGELARCRQELENSASRWARVLKREVFHRQKINTCCISEVIARLSLGSVAAESTVPLSLEFSDTARFVLQYSYLVLHSTVLYIHNVLPDGIGIGIECVWHRGKTSSFVLF